MAASLTRAARFKTAGIFSKLLNVSSHELSSLTRHLHTSLVCNVAGIPIKMPSLSPTMSEGTIVKWLKQEGDTVEPGDIICDIQTDKAVVSFEVEEEGILAKILLSEDSKDIAVGRMIAVMVEPGEDWKAVEVPAEEAAPAAAATPPPPPAAAAAPPAAEPKKEFSGLRHAGTAPTTAGPAVRTLLELYDIDATKVTATGRHGLLKSDVLAYITAHKLTPQPPTPVPAPGVVSQPAVADAAAPDAAYVDIPLSSMRKTIAKRLTQSKTGIPHAYMQSQARIDRLLGVRKQLKAEGVQASLNDYIVKATALSLRLHPQVNCVWDGDQLQRAGEVDVSVAVATDAGLITPIVTDAAGRSVAVISQQVQDLAARARQGKLKPHEFMGGTFTISNLGMFGVDEFSAIINPPQCGILAVGGGRSEVAVDGSTETWLTCTLSYDARAISETEAAAFMETLSQLLTNPELVVTDARRELQQLG